MPRISTMPTILEEKKFISLNELKKWGYLSEVQNKVGSIEWSRNGEVYSSIGLRSDIDEDYSYLILDYTKQEQYFKYRIDLVRVPSNLGKGEVFYFICPITKKRCRKLYLIGDYFAHREAYKNIYYEKQTYSKNMRDLDRFFSSFPKADKASAEMYSKHFKRFYNGQPTKRYKKLSAIIKRCHSYTDEDYFRLKKRRFF